MLPLTKEYATSERSKKPDREEAFVERWIEFFRKLTEDCGNSYWRWYNYEPLVVEGENIIAAVEWAYRSNKPQVVLDLMPSVYWYLDIAGHWNDVLKYGERALELANLVGDRLSVVGLMCLFGWTLGQMGKYSEGEQFLGQGLSTCKLIRGSGRYEAESAVLVHLGQIARKSGEYAKARSFYEKSSEVIESHDLSDQHQTNLDYEWGKLARDRGDWKLAKEYFAKVDDWAGRKEEKEQPFDVALARGAQGNYALALYHIGEYEKAKRLCIDSLKFFEQQGGKGYLAALKYRYALIEEALGEKETALKLAREALRLCQKVGMKPEMDRMKTLVERLKKIDCSNAVYREKESDSRLCPT